MWIKYFEMFTNNSKRLLSVFIERRKINVMKIIYKVFISLLLLMMIANSKSVDAIENSRIGIGKEYDYLRDSKNINIINPNQGVTEVDGKYNFSLQLINKTSDSTESGRYNKGTEYIVKGNYSIEQYVSTDSGVKKSKVFAFEKSDEEQYVYVRQAGFYMGKSIDIKLSIDTSKIDANSLFRVVAPDYSERNLEATGVVQNNVSGDYDNLGEAFLYLGSTTYGPHSRSKESGAKENTAFYYNSLDPSKTDSINYTYTFYETDLSVEQLTEENIKNKEPLSINGLWNIDNANYVKSIIDLNDFNDLTKYFIYRTPDDTKANKDYEILKNSNNVVYKENDNKQLEFTGNDAASNTILDPTSPIITPGYLHGKISTSLTTLFEDKSSLSYIVRNNYQLSRGKPIASGRGQMGVKYARSAIPRVAPTEPYILGIKNTAAYDSEQYTDLQYDIRFGIGSNDTGKRNDDLFIQTEVPEYYDINEKGIKIVDMVSDLTLENNKDYTIEIDPSNKNKAKIIFTNPSDDKINDGYFRISIDAKVNDKFDFSPDKYGYLNDSTSADNGYMHFDLAESTTLTYTHESSGNVNKTISSKKIDDRSIAKVNYEGSPTGEARNDLTLLQGNNLTDEYQTADLLLQVGFDKLVDTNNMSRDTPVTADFISPIPDTKDLPVGTVVDVPIRLTSALGVTKDVVAKVTIRSNKSMLNVEFRNEVDELLSSVQQEHNVGTLINLASDSEITDELNKYLLNGEYTLVERPNEEQFILTSTNGIQVYRLKGNLIIASAPELFDFGSHEKKLNDIKQKQAVNLDTQSPLIIKDRRADKSNGWTLRLKGITELNSGGEELSGSMIYRLNSEDSFTVSSNSEKAYEKKDGGDYNISEDWTNEGSGLGIHIDIKSLNKLGTYKAEIEWELVSGTGP